jgi:tRNA(His) 5'-end guanylyltransferase
MSPLRIWLGLGKKSAEDSLQGSSGNDHQEPLFSTMGAIGLAEWAPGQQVVAE